jgi:hypothetical protein
MQVVEEMAMKEVETTTIIVAFDILTILVPHSNNFTKNLFQQFRCIIFHPFSDLSTFYKVPFEKK